jgi:hypothetical protein
VVAAAASNGLLQKRFKLLDVEVTEFLAELFVFGAQFVADRFLWLHAGILALPQSCCYLPHVVIMAPKASGFFRLL